MTLRTCKVSVRGRVQGVFFRDSTRQQAEKYRISGYANNLSDGSVDILLSGESAEVEKVLSWISAGGPPAARVDSVEVQSLPADTRIQGFSVG